MQIKQQSFHYDSWTRLASAAAAAWSLMTYDPTAVSTSREGEVEVVVTFNKVGGTRVTVCGQCTPVCHSPSCLRRSFPVL